MYDFTHGQSDSIERVTHSICTLEFENHRPLYDWYIETLGIYHPQQIEFARLNLTYTVMSKRRLLELVEEGLVSGWDDPRMPTICGLRQLLEHCLREDLNKNSVRVMAVLQPLKLVIDNYPEDFVEDMDADNNPADPSAGKRTVPFSRELYIERDDFREDPPKKFFRLGPGREVRLRYGYFVTCTDFVKDEATGEVAEIHCTYDPQTRGGESPPDGRKVKGTIHWVSAAHAQRAEVRLYEHLFKTENPGDVPEGGSYKDNINRDSLEVLSDCFVEPGLVEAAAGERFQFERQGYFCVDPDSTAEKLVFNRTVSLRDSWAKIEKKGE
jgi:glutaminyl-tRNA synthetase